MNGALGGTVASKSPQYHAKSFRRVRLGNTFRSLRQAAGMSLDNAKAKTGWHVTKFSRIEGGTANYTPELIDFLLDTYGVQEEIIRNSVHELGAATKKHRWWEKAEREEVLAPGYGNYIEMEEDATHLLIWFPTILPPLVATSAYSQMTISPPGYDMPNWMAEQLLEVKKARTSVITRRHNPLNMQAIIHETSLGDRQIIPPMILREQLIHILHLMEMDNVTIRIMPNGGTFNGSEVTPISQFTFAPPHEKVTIIDHHRVVIEEHEHMHRYTDAMIESLLRVALSEDETISVIKERLARL